jgi:hypothetical protein
MGCMRYNSHSLKILYLIDIGRICYFWDGISDCPTPTSGLLRWVIEYTFSKIRLSRDSIHCQYVTCNAFIFSPETVDYYIFDGHHNNLQRVRMAMTLTHCSMRVHSDLYLGILDVTTINTRSLWNSLAPTGLCTKSAEEIRPCQIYIVSQRGEWWGLTEERDGVSATRIIFFCSHWILTKEYLTLPASPWFCGRPHYSYNCLPRKCYQWCFTLLYHTLVGEVEPILNICMVQQTDRVKFWRKSRSSLVALKSPNEFNRKY